MNKIIFIDKKVRDIEKNFFESLGYKVEYIPTNKKMYEEISSHTDIHMVKFKNTIIVEPTIYNYIKEILFNKNHSKDGANNDNELKILKGSKMLRYNYPYDVIYNSCVLGNLVISNFNYTDFVVKKYIENPKEDILYEQIHVNQGYAKCNISVLNSNAIVTSDKGIYENIQKYNKKIAAKNKEIKTNKKCVDVLFIPSEKLDIKLLKNSCEISKMCGFIGGATCVIDEYFCVFGDIKYIDSLYRKKLVDYVTENGLVMKYFEGLEIIDYGGIVVI